MKRFVQRIAATVLAAAMVFTAVPSAVFAEDGAIPPAQVQVENRWKVSLSASAHGQLISQSGEEVENGGSVTLEIKPEAGYQLHALWRNGQDITAQVSGNVCTLAGVDQDTYLYASFVPQGKQVKYLSDLDWASATQTTDGASPAKDKSINGEAPGLLNVYGTVFAKGLGTHAGHEIVYELNGAYTTFTALAAPNANCNAEPEKNMSIMGFEVYVDDVQKFADDSISFHDKDEVRVEVDVTGAKTLRLVTTAGSNGNEWSDDLDLADAQLWYDETTLETITLDGEPLEGFDPAIYAYSVTVAAGQQPPKVEAVVTGGAAADVVQANTVPGQATVTVGGVTYVISFVADETPKEEAAVTLSSSGHGQIVSQSGTEVESGANAELKVTPDDGYRLHALWCNGQDITSKVNESGECVLENVTQDLYIYANFAPQDKLVRYLSDLDWKSATQTTDGDLPAKDGSINGDDPSPLNVYGTVFAKGLGTHAGHEVVYELNGAYTTFTALAAPNANCNSEPEKNMSIMGFAVYADDKELFRNDHINFHEQDEVRVEIDVTGVKTLRLVTTAGDNGNEWSDDLDLADAQLWYTEPDLKGILVDGVELEGYSPAVYEYRVQVDPDGPVPQVEAVTKAGVQAEITQADKLPGQATVEVGDKVYTVFLATGDAPRLETFGLALAEETGLTGEGIVHQDGWVHVTVPEGTDVTALAPVFAVSDDAEVTVNGVPQESGVTKNNFSSPVTYRVSNANGAKEYTVQIGDWSTIPGLFADETAGKMERPSQVNYPGTLTMKLGLSWPMRGSKTESVVAARFDEALDIIRQVDNVTRGVPKVVYLVGWQYQGHDDKYPAWFQVNDNLKCTDCDHATSLDCMKWLMDEAYEKYNTRVSMHINSTDSYQDSPLWQTYVDNDLISKNSDGSLKVIGTWEGETSYQVNYKNEWEKGFYKQRVDRLIEMFDGRLERAGTIHSDAFFCRASLQSTVREEQEARVKMVRYWRDRGIDLTTEFLHNANEGNSGGSGSGMLGTIPMVWHFNQSIESYMQRPASMVTGGGINNIAFGNDKETVEILFGRSMWGEDLLTQRGYYGLDHRPDWDKEFRFQFCTQTLPWTYQNTFQRLSLENNVVTYSDGLVADANTRSVTRDGKLIREQDDVFVPVVWNEGREVIAYSTDGYTEKTWQFQKEWEGGATADVFSVDKNGLTPLELGVDVSAGSITLSLQAGQMVSIVPSGSVEITRPYPFAITAPVDGAANVDPAKATLQWGQSENAVRYLVSISEQESLEDPMIVEVGGCSLKLADLGLRDNAVYYWQVVACGKTGETLANTGGVHSFSTPMRGAPETPVLTAVRTSGDEVRLSWSGADLPYEYHVLRRGADETEYSELAVQQQRTYTDTIPATGVWRYKIVAVNPNTGEASTSAPYILGSEVYLSDLEPKATNMTDDRAWAYVKDADFAEPATSISLGGVQYDKGVSIHAPAGGADEENYVTYALDGQFTRFLAEIGTHDRNLQLNKPTSVRVVVELDGDEVLRIDTITIQSQPQLLDIDVTGAQELTLRVSNVNGSNDSDWSAWAAARLTATDAVLYAVDVENGTANMDRAAEDQTVELTADKFADREFLRWESEEVIFADAESQTTTFVMPCRNVKVKALYGPEKTPEPEETAEPSNPSEPENTPKPTQVPTSPAVPTAKPAQIVGPRPTVEPEVTPTPAPTEVPEPVLEDETPKAEPTPEPVEEADAQAAPGIGVYVAAVVFFALLAGLVLLILRRRGENSD